MQFFQSGFYLVLAMVMAMAMVMILKMMKMKVKMMMMMTMMTLLLLPLWLLLLLLLMMMMMMMMMVVVVVVVILLFLFQSTLSKFNLLKLSSCATGIPLKASSLFSKLKSIWPIMYMYTNTYFSISLSPKDFSYVPIALKDAEILLLRLTHFLRQIKGMCG